MCSMYDYQWITKLLEFLNLLKSSIWPFCTAAGFAGKACWFLQQACVDLLMIGSFLGRAGDTHRAELNSLLEQKTTNMRLLRTAIYSFDTDSLNAYRSLASLLGIWESWLFKMLLHRSGNSGLKLAQEITAWLVWLFTWTSPKMSAPSSSSALAMCCLL